jgi:hypothetical protein
MKKLFHFFATFNCFIFCQFENAWLFSFFTFHMFSPSVCFYSSPLSIHILLFVCVLSFLLFVCLFFSFLIYISFCLSICSIFSLQYFFSFFFLIHLFYIYLTFVYLVVLCCIFVFLSCRNFLWESAFVFVFLQLKGDLNSLYFLSEIFHIFCEVRNFY